MFKCECCVSLHARCCLSKVFCPFFSSDGADDDGAGDSGEPACWGVGGHPGVGRHLAAPLGPRAHWDEEPGQQLLPQLCHASALHRARFPDQVSPQHLLCVSVSVAVLPCLGTGHGTTLFYLTVTASITLWNWKLPNMFVKSPSKYRWPMRHLCYVWYLMDRTFVYIMYLYLPFALLTFLYTHCFAFSIMLSQSKLSVKYCTLKTCSCLTFSLFLLRYVSNIEKILDEAPSDPTQDFKTQVWVTLSLTVTKDFYTWYAQSPVAVFSM